MANSLLPPEERNLTPDQVEALDKRRELGHTLLVIAGQFCRDCYGSAAVGGSGPGRIRRDGSIPWRTTSHRAWFG